MDDEVKKFGRLIKGAPRILITSHISPDPDAICSLLLVGTTLKKNYPDKQVAMILEEEPLGLESLEGYGAIRFEPLKQAVEEILPGLIIILDANNFERCSRLDGRAVENFVRKNGIKTAIIDHHEPAGKTKSEVYVNQGSPAASQDVYEVLFDYLKLRKPAGYAQTALLGIYSDTNGFAYANPRHSATLSLTDKLISAGADIEAINSEIHQYTEDDMVVFGELVRNLGHQGDYNYSFISDTFINEWLKSGKTGAQLHLGAQAFINDFIRNIGGRKWGFIVYRNTLQGDGIYSVSLRAVGGTKDVSALAARLGGGGHKPAAGAKFAALSVKEAIKKVQGAVVEP